MTSYGYDITNSGLWKASDISILRSENKITLSLPHGREVVFNLLEGDQLFLNSGIGTKPILSMSYDDRPLPFPEMATSS